MPKRVSLGRLSRRSLAKGKCKIETAISELSLATVCSSAEFSDFVEEPGQEDSSSPVSSFSSDLPSLPKQRPCVSCCPSCCYPLLEVSNESNAVSGNVAKALGSASPSSLDQWSSPDSVKDCSSRTHEIVPQHVLLEYVKGLQDANKARDADTAERLLQELGECLNSLSAASTVVSAGGARTVASTLKLFRFHSLQKSFKDTMKDSRLGISKNPSNVGAAGSKVVEERKLSCAPDSWVGSTYKKSDKCSNPISTSMFLSNTPVVPTSGSVAAEVGRKRQRTAEDLDQEDLSEDEENSEASNCELSAESFGAFLSSDCELPETMDKVQENTLDVCYVEASREGFLKKVKEGGIGQDDVYPVGRLDGRCIVTSEHSARVIPDGSNSGDFAEDKCSDSLEIADEDNLVAGQNLGDLFVDGSLIPRNDGYTPSIKKIETSLSSGSLATGVFDSSTATSNRKRQDQKVNSNGRVNEMSQADSCSVGELRENREFQKHCKQNEQQYVAEENILARSNVEERVFKKISREHWTGQEVINTDEKTNEKSNVLSLTKEAGLADVVCAGCFVLERLLSVVLQGKGCLKNRSSISAGNGRRARSLRAEMYVALTEAFVEILHPLRDIVSMLTWCLDCLSNILPPCTSETCMGYSSVQNAVASCLASKDPRQKPLTQGEDCKVQTTLKCGIQSVPKDQEVVASKSALMSFSGSGTGKSQTCAVSLGNQLCNEIGTESTASSISALAAVAYSATVPMLAEKAVKGILQVIHPGDIDVEPMISAALRALSAHLSSATAKALCDDAFAFIIAAMKEFVGNAEIQIEGLIAIGSLTRALNSTTGHTAWVAVILSMDHHRTNLVVQRAGCRTLQSLCAKTAIGHSEWSNGKRPLRASKDSDREGGVRALISAMLAFPQDVRIQWYACSTMWILVHSAGVKSILTMVNDGAVMAVVGAMVVCRTNEVMQQEGCNVLGTMANTLAESDFKYDLASTAGSVVDASTNKVSCRCDITQNCKTIPEEKEKDGMQDDEKKGLATVNDWWAALWAVVEAMKAFRNSESVQSYGTYALGCMLKVFSEAGHSGSSVDLWPTPWLLIDAGYREMSVDSAEVQTGKLSIPALEMMAKDAFSVLDGTEVIFAKDILDGIGKLHTVVEVTMAAMGEFPKTETVQIWGCAVLQQAFPAYIQLAQHMLHFSNNSESGISTVAHNSTDSSRGSLTSQVSSFKNEQKPLPFMPVSSASFSDCENANIFFKGSYGQQSVEASSTDGYKRLVASISKCNSEMPSAAIVGETVDSNEDIISSESTKGESFQLTCFMNSGNIHISSLANQGEEAKPSMAQEAMDSTVLQCYAFVDLVLSQAISALALISKFAASDFNDTPARESKSNVASNQPCKASPRLFGNKFVSGKLQCTSGSMKPVVSVRQSWFAFLVVLGDMFGHLINNNESVEGGGSAAKSVINSDHQQRQEASSDKSEMASHQWDPSSNFASRDHEVHQQSWRDAVMLSGKKSCVGVSLSVKTAIIAVISVLSKIEDADTVIWALHAVSSLYTAWENICICKSGATNRQELKPNIWGDDDVGVKQLVDLVSYWTEQNRLDVTSSALQALNNACICAATINEIENVFGIQQCGMQAVLCALQKALGPSVAIQQRRKVIQLSCYVLSAVCGCSIRSQVSFATGGGADLVLAVLVRYGEDNQTFTSGLLALGIDSHLQPYFSELLNAAVSRNMTAGGGKFSKRKKNGSLMGNGVIGLNHVFKESIGAASPLLSKALKGTDIMMNGNESGQYRKEKWTSQLKSLLFDGKVQMGVFQTLLIASPGCGGPLFAVELLKSLNEESQIGVSAVEAQARVCTVLSYMADTDSNWHQELINAGAIEAVLATMGFVYSWRNENFSSFHLISDGTDNCLEAELEIQKMPLQAISSEREKLVSSGVTMISGERDSYDATIQCAACWALASLAKDHRGCFSSEWILLIQAVAVALRRYGGLAHPQNYGAAMVSSHPEAREMEEKVERSGQDEAIYRQGGSQCQTVTSDIFAPSGQGVTRETGEEFALEFVKEASKFAMSNSQGRSGLGQVTVPKGDFCETNPYVYEELTGILGIERMASGSNSDISMLTGKRANLTDFGSNCDPLYTESAQGTQIFGSINNGESQSDERLAAASAGQAEFQHIPYYSTHQSYLSGPSEDSCTGKVKFMCSFGGKILPRPSDGKLRYAGGETRIITVNKDIGYEELMQKMKDNYGQALMLKYQLPDEDLDALVSVSSDEDLENMMEEYKRLEGNEGSSRLRVFLFTVVDVDLTHFDSMTDRRKSEQKYVDAVNGIVETGFGKHADSTVGALSQQLENLIGLDVAENQNTTSRAQEDVVASLLLPCLPHDVAKVVHIPGIPPHSSEHTISSASSQTKSTPTSSPLSSQPIHFKQSRVADGPLHTFSDQLLQGDGYSSSLVHPPELDHGGPISSSGALSQNGLHYKFTESRRIPGSPTKAHQDLLPASYLDSMYHGDQGFIDAQLPRVESHGKLNWLQEQFEAVQPILNIRSDDQLCPVDLQRIVHQVSSTVHQPLWQHNLDTDQYIYNQTDYIQQSNSSGELVQQSVQQHSMQIANRNISQLPDHDAAVFRHTDQAQLHQDDAYGGPYMHKSISTDQLEPGVTAATVLQQADSSPPSPRQVGRGQQHVQGPCPPSVPFLNQHYHGTRVQYYNDQPGRTFNPSTSPCNNEQLPEQFGYQRIFLHEQLPHPEEWFACQQAIPYEQVIHHQALSHVHSDTLLQTHVMKPVNPTYEGIPVSQAPHSDGSVMPKASCVGSETFQEGFMPFQDFQEIGDLSNQVDNEGSQSQSIFAGQKFYGAVHVSSGLEEQPSAHRHFYGSSDEIDGAVRQKTLKQEENKTHIVMRTRRDHSGVDCDEESSELSRSSNAKPAISYTGMDFPENSSTFLLPCVGDSYQAFEKIENVEPFGSTSYQLKLANPAGQIGAMDIVTDALQASELTGRINQVAVPWSGSNAQELRTAHPLKEHAFGHHVANTNTQLLTVDQTLLGERVAETSLNAHLSTAGAEPSIPLSSPEIWWGGMGLDRDHIKAEASMYALGETRNSAEGLSQNTSHLIVNNEMSRPVDSEGVVLDEGSNILTSASEHHCAQLLGKSLIDDDVENSAYLLSDNLSNTRFVDELSSSSSVAMPVSVEGINQTSDLLNHDVIKDIFPQPLNLVDDNAGSVHVDESSEKDIAMHLKNEGVALDHITCQHHSDEEVRGDSKVVEDVTTEALRPNIFPALTLPVCEWDQASEDVRVEQIFCEKVTEVVDEEAITTQDSDFEEAKIEDSDKDEPISDAAIAEAEAIGHGLQIIKNADLEELRELGSGTFGTVYHGKWRGSDVAIKRIKNSCFMGRPSEQERLRADFWREACMLAHLHHPNVVAFYGVVPDGPGGALATVTEYMVNGSLKQVLQRKDRTIDRRKRLLITMDAAFGMEYLHGKNIVHFDLKCENLLVNMRDPQRPICKVGDLGLSKIKHQTLVSGGVRGTLPWMAPELLNGSSSMVSEKVDVFSFGIVMWELLTGEEPYANMHYGAIIGGIVNNTLRPPVPNWCDPAWRSLMEKCWSADPAARPSFTDIANQLRAIATSVPLKGQSHQAQLHGHS